MRRVIGVVFTVLALLGVQVPAAARAATPLPRLPVYLALGDSITVGQAAAPDPSDWPVSGYAGQVFDWLIDHLNCLPADAVHAADGCRQLQYLNMAELGATSRSVIGESAQLGVAEGLLRDRNRNANPRDDVEVITLSVGGNDLFGPLRAACLPPAPPAGCQTVVDAVLAAYAANLATILSTLRDAAGRVPIVMLTQYNPVPFCPLGNVAGASLLARVVLEGGVIPGLVSVSAGLNDVIRSTASTHTVRIAETYAESPPLLGANELVPPADCRHPNLQGHTVIAAVVEEALTGYSARATSSL